MDINNLRYNPDFVEYDPTAEGRQGGKGVAFTPLPDGTREYRLEKGSKGIEIKTSSKGNRYVNAHVLGTVIAPGTQEDGKKQSFWVTEFGSSKGDDGKNLPDIHCICRYAGITIPRRTSREELVNFLEQALSTNPIVRIGTRWQVRSEVRDENGKIQRRVTTKGMKSFPQNADGTYQFVAINGEEPELGVFFNSPSNGKAANG